jgi:4-diphosphocytidyl-2-C-methyl-D-erythritol kinase
MILFSKSKINLGLNILSKRSDGYHNIESIFYPIELCDVIEILPSKSFQLSIEGNTVDCPVEENLCYKAFNLFKKEYSIGNVHIILYKKIPSGAGLGGGSSNAACVLVGLNQLFELNLTTEQLQQFAAQLGSDCPFFLYNRPMFAHDTGTELSPVNLSLNNYHIVVIRNNVHISTRWAYSQIKPKQPEVSIKHVVQQYPIHEWKYYLKNDFEEPVFSNYPELAQLKKMLYDLGALYTSMTGSGSAIYGIFPEPLKKTIPTIEFFWQAPLINYEDGIR